MDMHRDVELGLTINPVYWDETPEICIKFNGVALDVRQLITERRYNWTLEAQDKNKLSVFFLNKKDSDTVDKLDKAVIIKELTIEGLTYKSFLNRSLYRPEYSEGYYTYAKENNIVVEPIIHSNYLGFNGEWYLEFTWPTFEWIYDVETSGLGWVYEKNI
jgi:hypothetical protein